MGKQKPKDRKASAVKPDNTAMSLSVIATTKGKAKALVICFVAKDKLLNFYGTRLPIESTERTWKNKIDHGRFDGFWDDLAGVLRFAYSHTNWFPRKISGFALTEATQSLMKSPFAPVPYQGFGGPGSFP